MSNSKRKTHLLQISPSEETRNRAKKNQHHATSDSADKTSEAKHRTKKSHHASSDSSDKTYRTTTTYPQDWMQLQQFYQEHFCARSSVSTGKEAAAHNTLYGMMTSKKFARQLAGKMYAKREFLPTYRMEPKVHFDCYVVYDIIKNQVVTKMEGFQ